MSKQQITIEVAQRVGKEISAVACSLNGEHSGTGAFHYDVVVYYADAWQWPEWVKSEWMAMDAGGYWHAYMDEPQLEPDHDFWVYERNRALIRDTHFDFTPPPCTDWRHSKRRRPT